MVGAGPAKTGSDRLDELIYDLKNTSKPLSITGTYAAQPQNGCYGK
jgi:hypothetical protein